MTALDQLADWPVEQCAAAVVGVNGVLATMGDQNMPYPLASVTKPLTAMGVLVAVKEEAIDLDHPLPTTDEFRLDGATLAHLLAHASGIAPDRRQRAAAPGTRRIYSNAGFELVGELLEAATEMPLPRYLSEAVFEPLGMNTTLNGSPASGGYGSVADLCRVIGELLNPTGLLDPSLRQAASTVQFPGLSGVLPGYGSQIHNDWGLGLEIRADKSPHWTSSQNSAATYGHFGRSGTMIWIDPAVQLGLVALSDRDFDSWAIEAWPALSTAVLAEFATTGG